MEPFTVYDLEKRVQTRAKADPGASYTRTLVDKGVAHCAKKLGEEAVEVAIAAIAEDRTRLVAETAEQQLVLSGQALLGRAARQSLSPLAKPQI